MKIRRLPQAFLLGASLLFGTVATTPAAFADSSAAGMERLTEKLRSQDFRMRVQAALLLGKTGDPRALRALTSSLDDQSVAVRAASAAALGILGDPAALPALRRHEDDESPAVRRRIESTISALEKKERSQLVERRSAKVLVKFDPFDSGESPEAIGAAAQASREALGKLTEIAMLNPSEDPQTASKRHARPVVMVRATLRKLSATHEGSDTVISADVEFLVERFPERSIMGRLSGNASVKSSVDSTQERTRMQEEAVGAAVTSALRSSEKALLAAGGRG